MPFVPILPTEYTTDRQDLNDALEAIIDAFIASANYEVGRKFLSEIPDSFTGEGPLIVLGDIIEEIKFTAQLWITAFHGTLFYLDWITDRGEYNTRVNAFADHMRALFAVNRSTVDPNAVLVQTGFSEGVEFKQGIVVVGAPSLTFTYTIQRGDPGGNPA